MGLKIFSPEELHFLQAWEIGRLPFSGALVRRRDKAKIYYLVAYYVSYAASLELMKESITFLHLVSVTKNGSLPPHLEVHVVDFYYWWKVLTW